MIHDALPGRHERGEGISERRWWLAQGGAWVLVCLPLLATDLLPLLDYPGHLVRVHLLARWSELVGYEEFYRPAWAVLPNLALELVAVPLAKVFSAPDAVRVFCFLAFALIIHGGARLARIAAGSPTYWCIAPALLIFNYIFSFGFLNFVFAFGVGLVALALHIEHRDRRVAVRAARELLVGAVVFVCHVHAFVLYLVAAVTVDLATAAQQRRAPRELLRDMLVVAMAGVIPGLLLAFSPAADSAGEQIFESLQVKLMKLMRVLSTGQGIWDRVYALALAAGIGALFVFGKLRLNVRLTAVTGALALVFLTVPFAAFGAANIDTRLPLTVVLMAMVSVDASRVRSRRLLAVLVPLLLFRVATTTVHYSRWGTALTSVRNDLRAIPPGSIVFSAYLSGGAVWLPGAWRPPLVHASELLLLDRPAFLPSLFADPRQQPLHRTPAFASLPTAGVVDTARASLDRVPARLLQAMTLAGRREPAYLFFVDPPPSLARSAELEPVLRRPRFALYRLVGEPEDSARFPPR